MIEQTLPESTLPVTRSATVEWVALPRKPLLRKGRLVAAVLVVCGLAAVVGSLATNPNLDWGTVGTYLFARPILRGVLLTLELGILAFILGVLLGFGLALMRRSRLWAVSRFAQGYVWVFRSLPQLIQIIFWYNLAVLYPRLVFEIPLVGWTVADVSTTDVMHKFTAALLALTLSEAAYQAEIIRGALLGIPTGQREAAMAIGMTGPQTMRRVLLPQALVSFVPPAGNEFTHLLKGTSVVAFITLADLMYSVQLIYSQNYQVIPLLLVASLWYLALIGAASLMQGALERALR